MSFSTFIIRHLRVAVESWSSVEFSNIINNLYTEIIEFISYCTELELWHRKILISAKGLK